LSESRGGSSFGESIFSYCGQRYSWCASDVINSSAAMLDDKHIQNGGMLCLTALDLILWEFYVLCMAAETTICGMVPRDSLGFQKSLQITTRKEKPNYYQLNDVVSGLITLAVKT
jgi:hypothetical protein